MDEVVIPDDIARFILLGIPSVPYLEAMLLMRRETSQPWDAGRMAQRLYLNEKAARSLLAEMHARSVVECIDQQLMHYRYRPDSEELSRMVDRLADIYARNLIGVTNFIHSRTSKKAQHFADAFIWRKET